MKNQKAAVIAGGIFLGIGVVLAATNPGRAAYEEFATQAAIVYLKDEVCAKAPTTFGIQDQCRSALESNQPQIRQMIAAGTQQKNFVLFSIYTTDLSMTSLLPSYHFETVGILRQFHIYKAIEQK